MRLFVLLREEDVTGVSGTGIVAEGVEWQDGRVGNYAFSVESGYPEGADPCPATGADRG